MEYNTSREKITIGEYGRHIKRIVDKCVQIEDRDRRNQTAREIIDLMGQLNPQLRNVEDFRHKLWDHLFMISEFKLDVDSPYPKTKKTQIIEKPEPLPYPQSKIRLRHYGKIVDSLVEKAKAESDPAKRAAFAQCIGNYMKLTYVNWNKENTNDEIIKNDLRILSKGELSLTEADNISELARHNKPPHPVNTQNKQHTKGKNWSNNNQKSNNPNNNPNKPYHKNKNWSKNKNSNNNNAGGGGANFNK